MATEHYLQRESELVKQLADLRENYINANKPYEIGQRLRLIERGKETIAEVVGFEIGYREKVVPTLKKVKKDGTISSIEARIWSFTKVEAMTA